MNWFAQLVLVAWIPFVLLAFGSVPPRRALLSTLIGGWLFLPWAGFEHLTGYQSKFMVVSVGLLAAALRYAPAGLGALRLRAIDLPMLVWCLAPFVTALANGLGPYEGAAAVLANVLRWGVPYAIGRAYFADRAGPRKLALGIVAGGLVYVPLCLWEIRMSPQLHATFYGFYQHQFIQTVRSDGSWRPVVFLQHGLMVALWMAAAALCALWVWRRGRETTFARTPLTWVVLALAGTTVLTRSVGAVVLLLAGVGVLLVSGARLGRALALVVALVVASPVYMAFRGAGTWSGSVLVTVASRFASEGRVASLAFRLENEQKLVQKAIERPVLGWGRYGRWLVYDEDKHAATPDGFWVIALGEAGVLGLVSITAAMLLPVLRVVRALRGRRRLAPELAPTLALAVIVALFMIDNLFNAMINPVYVVAAGALAGVDVAGLLRAAARRRAETLASAARAVPAAAAVTGG